MSIPLDWLRYPVAFGEVERVLQMHGASESWLRQWRAFVDGSDADDELWTYFADEFESDDDPWACRVGFALLRDGAVVDWIEAAVTIND